MSGSEQLVRAWLDGDWSAIESGFFANEWSDKVIIPQFTIPAHWTRLRSMDWGFSTPFAVYWAAVAGDDHPHAGRVIPRGALVIYREWYGSPASQLSTGLRMTAPEIATGIITREAGERVSRAVLDPRCNERVGTDARAVALGQSLPVRHLHSRSRDSTDAHPRPGQSRGSAQVSNGPCRRRHPVRKPSTSGRPTSAPVFRQSRRNSSW